MISEPTSREAALIARHADGQRAMIQWIIGLFMALIAVMAGLLKMFSGH